jgi:hypothetical protein
MHCQDLECTRFFDMGLISPEGQKLECFIKTPKDNFISIMKV